MAYPECGSERPASPYDSLRDVDWTRLLASAIGLLRIARCPDCKGEGWYVREVGGCDSDGENDTRECVQEQCQWCYEREGLLAEYDKANTGGQAPAASDGSLQPLVRGPK